MTAETLATRIQELLGQGLPTTVVSSAVGCDPSYVSQLLEDEEFKEKVLLARAGKAEASVKKDNKWDSLEDLALDRAITMAQHLSRPSELVRIASLANSAKRRATEFANGSESAAPTVNLVLPESSVIHFQMNAQSQVVSVEGRSMIPLPSKHLAEQIKQRRENREAAGVVTVDAVPRALPSERKKCETILEQIGYSDEPVPVEKVL